MNLFKTILTILFFIPVIGKCQKDSVEFHKISNNYIEIKTLRYILDTGYSEASSYTKMSLIPNPIKLKNGIVIIKDRLNKPLAIYIYSDSINIIEEHYVEGRIEWQRFNNNNNSVFYEKWFWKTGNLKSLEYKGTGMNELYKYTEDGQLIEEQK